MIKPLIFIPSPRNIEPFNNAAAQLHIDKLWVKYYPEIEAYQHARDYFLKHREEYTHLIILPDDLIVTEPDLYVLMFDINRKHYDVISGWCRNTIRQMYTYQGHPETEETAASNVSYILPPYPPAQGTYDQYQFIPISDINRIRNDKAQNDIVQVKYAGFAPTIISRQVIEQIPFRIESCCVDSCFAHDLYKAGIAQYCDLCVKSTHLELRQREPPNLLIGKQEAKITLEKGNRL
jgi:hypothetical protein